MSFVDEKKFRLFAVVINIGMAVGFDENSPKNNCERQKTSADSRKFVLVTSIGMSSKKSKERCKVSAQVRIYGFLQMNFKADSLLDHCRLPTSDDGASAKKEKEDDH